VQVGEDVIYVQLLIKQTVGIHFVRICSNGQPVLPVTWQRPYFYTFSNERVVFRRHEVDRPKLRERAVEIECRRTKRLERSLANGLVEGKNLV
jgi:hypothetical protein